MPGKFAVGVALVRKAEAGEYETLVMDRTDGLLLFPGGKVEREDSIFDAIRRELEKETGVVVEDVRLVMHTRRDLQGYHVSLFVGVTWEGEPVNREPDKCLSLRWVTLDWLAEHGSEDMKYYARLIPHTGLFSLLDNPATEPEPTSTLSPEDYF